jgi:hypothetical protein
MSIGTPQSTIAPGSASDVQLVRHAAANTLRLKAAASFEFAGLSSAPIFASGSFDFRQALGRELVRQPSGAETLVFLSRVVFDRPPAQQRAALPRDKPWVMADFNEQVSGSTLAQFLLGAEGRDPGFLLAEVAWGAKAAAPLGRRVINGTATTGYEVHVDLAEAAAAASGPRAAGFVRTVGFAEQALGTGAATGGDIRMWVDPSDRVVRLRASPPGSGVGTTIMTMSSFGVRVDPVRPAGRQTVDLAALTAAGDVDRD